MGSLGKTLIATALATGVVAAPAAAATMQATFTGTVTNSFLRDDFDIFSNDPSTLEGLEATITLVFNTANSVFGTQPVIGGSLDVNSISTQIAGGEGYLTLAQFLLNGVTINLNLSAPVVQATSIITDAVWDEFDGAADGRFDWLYQQTLLTSLNETSLLTQEQLSFAPFFDGLTSLPDSLDAPFSVDLTETGWGSTSAFYQFQAYNPQTIEPGQAIPTTNVELSGLNLTVICLEDCGDDNGGGGGEGGGPTDPSVVPLPASGILLLGAGVALGALRRRKTRAA